jgi:signal-transduction protein with cAMP-binding, CBS, and nucleotidyltransferase domain
MDPLLSAKGGDITTWRAVENFTAEYRQSLMDRAVSDRGGSVESVYAETGAAVNAAITTHQELVKRLETLIEEVPTAPPLRLKELTGDFYSTLYRHFDIFRSAPTFYQLSMAYLRQATAAIAAQTIDQLGLFARHLPELTLVAVGPAGRGEYSPYCPLQILLVHGEVAASQLEGITLFCHTLHAGFEEAGLIIDPAVTPRNERWRGTLAEWRQHCEEKLHSYENEELIDLYRLVDQSPLFPAEGLAPELKRVCNALLSGNRAAVAKLVDRMAALSNGLGLMGRIKLERSGSERGMFRLLDHGLLPFSAALSALALIKQSTALDSCDRIRDLLRRRELDVDLSERMLATWHTLNDLRLGREQSFQIGDLTKQAVCLNPDEMSADQRQLLKETLESVAFIQRHVEIIFSGTGE